MLRHLMLSTAFVLAAGVGFAQDKPAATPAAPAQHAYIGVKTCKMCHTGEAKGNVYEKWAASKHSQAYQALVDKKDGSEKNPACLVCHTTGYGKGGFALDDSVHIAKFQGVQCEMCHGAGADFKALHNKKETLKEAAAAGFVAKPDVTTCKQCHNEKSPTFDKNKPFNFEAMHKIIDHRYRDKAKADAAK